MPAVGARSTESDLMHTLCTYVVTRGARMQNTEIPGGRKYAILQYMIMHTFWITKTLRRTVRAWGKDQQNRLPKRYRTVPRTIIYGSGMGVIPDFLGAFSTRMYFSVIIPDHDAR